MAKRKKKSRFRKKKEESRSHTKIMWRAYLIFVAIIGLFLIGVLGFMHLEPGMTPLKAFHLTMQTLTTVGYGDVAPETDGGRLLSDVLMVFGLAIATFGVASLLEFIVSGKLREAMRTRDYEGMIAKLKGHVIVCGHGRVGKAAIEELESQDVEYVLLEKDKQVLEDIDLNLPRIIGNATQDEELLKCGIKKAIAIIAASGSDADNLMITVTAKYIKPDIIAIARSNVEEDKEKFLKVGADMVVSPETEGGKSMARMLKDVGQQVIIAGYGRVGVAAAQELQSMGIELMVMDRDEEALQHAPANIKHMTGDVTKEADLIQAGIDRSAAVVPVCGVDSNNLLATVTAKYYKPSITVITRASSQEDVGKMLKVGADVVISPEIEGGKSMAKWAAQAHHLAEAS